MENTSQGFVSPPIINNDNTSGWKKLSKKGEIFYFFVVLLEFFFLFINPFLGILGEDRGNSVRAIFSTLIMMAIFPTAFVVSIGGIIIGFIYCFRKKAYFAGSFLLVLSLLTFPAISLFLERIPAYRNIITSIDEKRDETSLITDSNLEINNETKTEIRNQQTATVKDDTTKSPTTPSTSIPDLKPYQVRFIFPANGTKVQLGEMLNVKVQVGEKIKKVIVNNTSYFYNPTNSPHSGVKSLEVPVQGGYANYSSRVDGTLVPITFYLEGVSDDPVAYAQAESNLSLEEAQKMFLEIKPFTNQPIEYFALENKSEEVTYLYYPTQEYRVPQFIAGFPVHGIVAVPSSDIEFVISDPTILSIIKNSQGPVFVKGLKNGSTKVTAKYKGRSQEIFFFVEYAPPGSE